MTTATIDPLALRRYIDPYVMMSVLADPDLIESIRTRLHENGWTVLLPDETRTGYPVRIYLRDIR